MMKTNKENIKLGEKATRNPFSVPEGYFDRLPSMIMEQTTVEGRMKKTPFLIRELKPITAIAASLAILMILVSFPYHIFRSNNFNNRYSALISEEYFITSSVDDQKIFETLESDDHETPIDQKELENVLLGSVNEYELIVLNN